MNCCLLLQLCSRILSRDDFVLEKNPLSGRPEARRCCDVTASSSSCGSVERCPLHTAAVASGCHLVFLLCIYALFSRDECLCFIRCLSWSKGHNLSISQTGWIKRGCNSVTEAGLQEVIRPLSCGELLFCPSCSVSMMNHETGWSSVKSLVNVMIQSTEQKRQERSHLRVHQSNEPNAFICLTSSVVTLCFIGLTLTYICNPVFRPDNDLLFRVTQKQAFTVLKRPTVSEPTPHFSRFYREK